jgi:hypothetical protein
MIPEVTQRATLAAIEAYEARRAELRAQLAAGPPGRCPRDLDPAEAMSILYRARRAELLDPDPLPHIRRNAE